MNLLASVCVGKQSPEIKISMRSNVWSWHAERFRGELLWRWDFSLASYWWQREDLSRRNTLALCRRFNSYWTGMNEMGENTLNQFSWSSARLELLKRLFIQNNEEHISSFALCAVHTLIYIVCNLSIILLRNTMETIASMFCEFIQYKQDTSFQEMPLLFS